MRIPVELRHASRLVNHGPTVLVTTRHAGRRNLMAAAWSMPVEFTPPRIAVVIDKSTWTRELAEASGMLGLCVPGRAQADLTWTVGSVSGRPQAGDADWVDKFTRYRIDTFDGPVLGLPMPQDGVAWMECRLIEAPNAQGLDQNRHPAQAYDTLFVEVVSATADPRVFRDGRWSFHDDNADLHTLHHLGAGRFAVPSVVVQGSLLPE